MTTLQTLVACRRNIFHQYSEDLQQAKGKTSQKPENFQFILVLRFNSTPKQDFATKTTFFPVCPIVRTMTRIHSIYYPQYPIVQEQFVSVTKHVCVDKLQLKLMHYLTRARIHFTINIHPPIPALDPLSHISIPNPCFLTRQIAILQSKLYPLQDSESNDLWLQRHKDVRGVKTSSAQVMFLRPFTIQWPCKSGTFLMPHSHPRRNPERIFNFVSKRNKWICLSERTSCVSEHMPKWRKYSSSCKNIACCNSLWCE